MIDGWGQLDEDIATLGGSLSQKRHDEARVFIDAMQERIAKKMGPRFERRDPDEVNERCAYCLENVAEGYAMVAMFGVCNPICRACQNAMVDKFNEGSQQVSK